MKIIIFGFTGVGKTTFLEHLKHTKDLDDHEFIDLDSYILSLSNDFASISELISSKGWEYFRALELKLIKELLRRPNIVLALGGGAVSKELISFVKKVGGIKGKFLDLDFITCWNRIKNDQNRPIVLGGIKECEVLYKKRLILFRELKSICLDY